MWSSEGLPCAGIGKRWSCETSISWVIFRSYRKLGAEKSVWGLVRALVERWPDSRVPRCYDPRERARCQKQCSQEGAKQARWSSLSRVRGGCPMGTGKMRKEAYEGLGLRSSTVPASCPCPVCPWPLWMTRAAGLLPPSKQTVGCHLAFGQGLFTHLPPQWEAAAAPRGVGWKSGGLSTLEGFHLLTHRNEKCAKGFPLLGAGRGPFMKALPHFRI